MENHNIRVKQNLNIEVNSPCPKCDNGHLVPFLRPVYKRGNSYGIKEFDYYEIYYRCSYYPECDTIVEG